MTKDLLGRGDPVIRRLRQAFADKDIHVFGVGGTATLHLAGLLGMNSVDSSGWPIASPAVMMLEVITLRCP